MLIPGSQVSISQGPPGGASVIWVTNLPPLCIDIPEWFNAEEARKLLAAAGAIYGEAAARARKEME
jgi:hypothetical protein